jgi:lipoprotein-anchoring transpeptidase ErfK/SrfK
MLRQRALSNLCKVVLFVVAASCSGIALSKRSPAQQERAPASSARMVDAINDTDAAREIGPKARGAEVVRAQILLDRAWFSPGEIDGVFSDNMRRAVVAFQKENGLKASGKIDSGTWEALSGDGAEPLLMEYTITDKDEAGPFERLPRDLMDRAKLKWLGYESLPEELGERFHVNPKLLRQLNPGKTFKAGTEIWVPAVQSDKQQRRKATSIAVVKKDKTLQALDKDGRIVAQFPVSLSGPHDPLVPGPWKIKNEVKDPVFSYNPELMWDAKAHHQRVDIAPGPNSPIGSMWLGLTKPHDGIHGTAEPSRVGRTETHGCLHLTNWDVQKLSALVNVGTPVKVIE